MDHLSFTQNGTHYNVVNTIYDEIIEDTEFSDEMIRIYSNILSNKLDNHNIDNINNDVHTKNLISNKRKSLKRKCNDDAYNKKNDVNTKKINPISWKSRKILSASKCSNFRLNDKTKYECIYQEDFND